MKRWSFDFLLTLQAAGRTDVVQTITAVAEQRLDICDSSNHRELSLLQEHVSAIASFLTSVQLKIVENYHRRCKISQSFFCTKYRRKSSHTKLVYPIR